VNRNMLFRLGDPGQRPDLDPRAGGMIDGVVLLESTRQVGLQVLYCFPIRIHDPQGHGRFCRRRPDRPDGRRQESGHIA
jgi:hypothetical protein